MKNKDIETLHFYSNAESSFISEKSEYTELILKGVNCSCCDKKLSNSEILVHRFTGIIDPNEMLCESDWARVAFCLNNKPE